MQSTTKSSFAVKQYTVKETRGLHIETPFQWTVGTVQINWVKPLSSLEWLLSLF